MPRGQYIRSEKYKRNMSISMTGKHSGPNNPMFGKSTIGFSGRYHSELSKNKLSTSLKGKFVGENNPMWKGGVTTLYKSIRDLPKSSEWRIQIFDRDNFICQLCRKFSEGDLNAHHIKRFIDIISDNNLMIIEDAIKCDVLWDLDNGITLCEECHRILHKVI